jgi:hypothetical protein
MNLKIFLIISIALFSISATAECELTDEYKKARTMHVQEARKAYDECVRSVSNANHSYKYVQCFEAGDGKGVGGGCGHLAGFPNDGYKSLGINSDFCKVLKPTTEQMKESFYEYVGNVGIVKCKKI